MLNHFKSFRMLRHFLCRNNVFYLITTLRALAQSEDYYRRHSRGPLGFGGFGGGGGGGGGGGTASSSSSTNWATRSGRRRDVFGGRSLDDIGRH